MEYGCSSEGWSKHRPKSCILWSISENTKEHLEVKNILTEMKNSFENLEDEIEETQKSVQKDRGMK